MPSSSYAAAAPSCFADGGALSEFLEPVNVRKECQQNLGGQGADVDRRASRQQRREYMSACADTHQDIQEAAEEFRGQQQKKCGEINRLRDQALSCSGQAKSTEQKQCYERAANMYRRAKEMEGELAKQLRHAKQKIVSAKKANQKALEDYRQDMEKMNAAVAAESRTVKATPNDYLESSNKIRRAPRISQGRLQNGSGAGEVTAKNGGEATIWNYQNKVEELKGEQQSAISRAQTFEQKADAQMKRHEFQQQQYATLEREARARNSRISKAGDEKKTDAPVKPDPETKTESDPKKAQASPGPQSSTPKASAAPQDSQVSQGGGGSGGSGGGGYADDFAHSAGDQASKQSKSIGTSESVSNSNGQRDKSQLLKAIDISPEAARVGDILETRADDSGGLADRGAEADQGTSRLQNRGGTSLKPVGATTGRGGAGTRAASGKEAAAALTSFHTDLHTGALDIAGSDVHSAMTDLSEELGAEPLLATSQGLTVDEKLALGEIDDDLDDMDSSPVGAMESEPLFVRTHAAHVRAQQKGLLITKIRGGL